MNKSSIDRSIWLLNTLYQAGSEGLSFEEIRDRWKLSPLSKGMEYPLRSFHNHRNEIRESFNVYIKCRKSSNRYYIAINEGNSSIVAQLIGVLNLSRIVSTGNALHAISMPHVKDGGEAFLPMIMQAIEHYNFLEIIYLSQHNAKDPDGERVAPLGLKNYKGCWSLLCQREDGQYVMIDLRTIKEVRPTVRIFKAVDKQLVDELLVENYGLTLENIPTQEITVKVEEEVAKRLTDFPLHSSQRLIESKKPYSIFYYNLKPTMEFVCDLMTLGAGLEILTPTNLRTALAKEARKIARQNV